MQKIKEKFTFGGSKVSDQDLQSVNAERSKNIQD